MVVEAVAFVAKAKGFVPCKTCLLPLLEPIHFGARLNEELHLHLFELTHTEDELASYDLVTEGFTNLSDTERYLHTARLLHVEVVNEDALCRFRTEVDCACAFSGRTYFGLKHEVELANVSPIACA